jgi:prefoldin subunit 5
MAKGGRTRAPQKCGEKTMTSSKNFDELMRSIRNRTEHPQGDFNRRANVCHVVSPLNAFWRDKNNGEALALLTLRDGKVHVALFNEDVIRVNGSGLTAREAYREAWRELRLRRHDPADLLRQIADLRRALGHELGQALERLNQHVAEIASRLQAENARVAVRSRRRARHAAACRAHRSLRQAWHDLDDEVKDLRQQVDELTEELERARNEARDLYRQRQQVSAAINAARENDPLLRTILPDRVDGPRSLASAVELLLHHGQRSAQYLRRATAAEARAAALRAGQDSLLAAARRAGFEYTVVSGSVASVAFVPTAQAHETETEPSTNAPTGGEMPTDRPQAAPDAEQSA